MNKDKSDLRWKKDRSQEPPDKMQKTNKHPYDKCNEARKLKRHIYCVHSGKYKTMMQGIDEYVPYIEPIWKGTQIIQPSRQFLVLTIAIYISNQP